MVTKTTVVAITVSEEPTMATITWKNGDDVIKTEQVEYGKVPVYSGETPTKAATAQYTYTFKGWDPEVVAVTGDATYTATYTETVNKYKITWKSVTSARIDTGALRKALPDVAAAFTKETTVRRFCVA